MTIKELTALLGAETLTAGSPDEAVSGCYTGDMLSDVMANANRGGSEGGALVTIQAHKNTVAVATLVNINVIVVCNNRPCPDDMLDAAKEEGIAVIRTHENQFTVSGKIYDALRLS
jgi:predicted transcriptional regulator